MTKVVMEWSGIRNIEWELYLRWVLELHNFFTLWKHSENQEPFRPVYSSEAIPGSFCCSIRTNYALPELSQKLGVSIVWIAFKPKYQEKPAVHFTIYPGTDREQLAGRKPLCKCLNRFELRVPGRIHQMRAWSLTQRLTEENFRKDKRIEGQAFLTAPQESLVWQLFYFIKRGAFLSFHIEDVLNWDPIFLTKIFQVYKALLAGKNEQSNLG